MYRLRIREIAEAKGIKQIAFVRQGGFSPSTANKLFNDETMDLKLSTLQRIAQILEVPITDLIEDILDAPHVDGAPE